MSLSSVCACRERLAPVRLAVYEVSRHEAYPEDQRRRVTKGRYWSSLVNVDNSLQCIFMPSACFLLRLALDFFSALDFGVELQ